GRWEYGIPGNRTGVWPLCDSAIGLWERPQPRTSIWNIKDVSWAIFSIHELDGQPRKWPALRLWRRRLPRPTHWPLRFSFWGSTKPALTARNIPVSGLFYCPRMSRRRFWAWPLRNSRFSIVDFLPGGISPIL